MGTPRLPNLVALLLRSHQIRAACRVDHSEIVLSSSLLKSAMAEKERMIIDLCFSSDDEKEKETRARSTSARRTRPRMTAAEPDSQDSAALAEPEALAEAAAGARAAEPAGAEAESVKREAPPGAERRRRPSTRSARVAMRRR